MINPYNPHNLHLLLCFRAPQLWVVGFTKHGRTWRILETGKRFSRVYFQSGNSPRCTAVTSSLFKCSFRRPLWGPSSSPRFTLRPASLEPVPWMSSPQLGYLSDIWLLQTPQQALAQKPLLRSKSRFRISGCELRLDYIQSVNQNPAERRVRCK